MKKITSNLPSTLMVRDVPATTKQEFKLLCVKKRLTMNEAMILLIEQAVRDKEVVRESPGTGEATEGK